MPGKLFDTNETLIAYADGGSRGNPGPAAFGAVIGDSDFGEYLGVQTNNYAEYHGALFVMKKAKQLLGKERAKRTRLELRMDSELVVKQLNHQYKINDPTLQRIFIEIWNAMLDYGDVTVVHVPRAQNSRADAAVNRVLDSRLAA